MPSRPGPGTLLAILILLLATPAGSAAPEGWDPGFTPATAATAFTRFELHGSSLAWLSKTSTGINVVLTELEGGGDRILTTIPSEQGASLSVGCLAFDGTWVAWCDDRFGNMDVFAVEVASRRLVRISEGPTDDVEAALGDGRMAWSSGGAIWLRDLANGTSWRVDTGPGMAREPALAGETLAWIRLDGYTRYVVAGDLAGGGARALSGPNGTFAHALVGEGDALAWEVYVQRFSDRPEAGFAGTVLQAVQAGGPVQNVTRVPDFQAGRSSPLATDLGGHRVAWLDPTEREIDAKSHDLRTGAEDVLASKAQAVAVSDSHLAAYVGVPGSGQIWVLGWDEGGAGDGGKGVDAPAPALALSSLAAAALLRRRT
ncbi:MAG TPA: hypothetical protein VJ874_07045 [Candidatus Thermoplasmatota archaeon]|nr:hypothetical protein [Candidatus Thermoplasmatota archaeon]